MALVYILLIIIAIGALLASKAGQELLKILGILAIIGGLLYLGFWIVVIAIVLLSDRNIRQGIAIILGTIMFIAYAIYLGVVVYKKHQRGELTKKIIKQAVKKKARDLWLESWRQHKIITIFLILAFSFLAIMLIYSFTIKGFWQQ